MIDVRLLFLSCGLVVMSLDAVSAEIIDRVLAVAAGELIMLSDVTAARDLGLVKMNTIAAGAEPIGAVLSQLIDRELVLAEVDRYAPPEPGAEAIDRELQEVRARFPTPQAFAAVLARSGIDEHHLRETLRQNLRIRAYEEQRFTVQSGAHPGMVYDYGGFPPETYRITYPAPGSPGVAHRDQALYRVSRPVPRRPRGALAAEPRAHDARRVSARGRSTVSAQT